MKASQFDPSPSSPSPVIHTTFALIFWYLNPRAMPTAIGIPWPKDPVDASQPVIFFESGCIPYADSYLLNVLSDSIGTKPRIASVGTYPKAQWPFDKMNLSLSFISGFFGSILRYLKYRAVNISATESEPPTWPDPALKVVSIMFIRNSLALSFNSCTDKLFGIILPLLPLRWVKNSINNFKALQTFISIVKTDKMMRIVYLNC